MAAVTLTKADDGGTVTLSQGDELLITLPEVPTTGYRWQIVQADEAVVATGESRFEPAAAAAVGGGGQRSFTLAARGPGSTRIRLALRRGWEGDAPAADQFAITVTVRNRGG